MLNDCLRCVEWADEIVVVDLGSSDDTVEIAKRFGAKVYEHPHVNWVELVRNFSFELATGDWILMLDPDERVPPKLAEVIRALIRGSPQFTAVRIPFCHSIFGKIIDRSGWGHHALTRLFRRGHVTWRPEVHSQPEVSGAVLTLPYSGSEMAIFHLNYSSVSQWVEKMNRYTTAEAQRLRARHRSFHPLKLFYQPAKEFWNRYFIAQGFRDGLHGLILSLLMAFYYLVTYVKLWELERNESASPK